jgi:hypothetical protein
MISDEYETFRHQRMLSILDGIPLVKRRVCMTRRSSEAIVRQWYPNGQT